jgi:hypothetical protein
MARWRLNFLQWHDRVDQALQPEDKTRARTNLDLSRQ